MIAALLSLFPVFVWDGDVLATAKDLKPGARVAWYGVSVGRFGIGLLRIGRSPEGS